MVSQSRFFRADLIALLLSLAAIFASYLVATRIYECLPHVKDEIAYAWQAQAYAQGQLTIDLPKYASSFTIPFVVDYQGQRFAKYPPGWPVVLALGVALGFRAWVNPLLAGLAVWLTYRLGQKLFGDAAGLLAAFLTVTSPFFLMVSGSLLAHPWSLVLTSAFALAWLDTFNMNRDRIREEKNNYLVASARCVVYCLSEWITVLIAGLSLGILALTRPLTSLGVALAFLIHALILLRNGDYSVRVRVLCIGLIAAGVAALVLAWQFAVTGNSWLNPYTLWWKYDRVGFGQGHGRMPGGHSLHYGWLILKRSLRAGWRDLFGWGKVSWLFLPVGLWAIRRNYRAWLIAALPFGLALVYLAYWFGSTLYGPRYYFEGFPGLTLTTSTGMLWLLDWSRRYKDIWHLIRCFMTVIIIFGLVGYNLLSFLPHRLNNLYSLYNSSYSQIEVFQSEQAKALTPAVVLVYIDSSWTDYETLLDLENPWLTSPFIFAISRGKLINEELAAFYPARSIIYYHTNQPYKLFVYRQPEK
jgi:4-amino-4-deoxy-L-arabinose transferase-like glycosyltransferase